MMRDLVMSLVGLASRFALVNRTGPTLPDGSPESDTDHTVSLLWVACSLAHLWPELDVGLVAQFAAVHDAPEVYAGDVPTQKSLTAEQQRAKDNAEAAAAARITAEFGYESWFVSTLREYESMATPEARYVWAVDKVLPKAICALRCSGFTATRPEYREMLDRQQAKMRTLDIPEWLVSLHEYVGSLAYDCIDNGCAADVVKQRGPQ